MRFEDFNNIDDFMDSLDEKNMSEKFSKDMLKWYNTKNGLTTKEAEIISELVFWVCYPRRTEMFYSWKTNMKKYCKTNPIVSKRIIRKMETFIIKK